MKETSRSQLWVNGVVIAVLAGLTIFFLVQEQFQEKVAPVAFPPGLGKVKKYSLNYASKLGPQFALELGSFEKQEAWQGGFFDTKNFYEGKSSYSFSSKDHAPAGITIAKKVNLQDYPFFDLLVFVYEPRNLESLDLKFGNSNLTNYYQYKINNLQGGWNFVRMPRKHFLLNLGQKFPSFDWSKIERIEVLLTSRPTTRGRVNLDSLRAAKNLKFLNDWVTENENLLGVGKVSEDTRLLAGNSFGPGVATLKKVAETRDFIFQASISPQRGGSSGLFFRGNYQNDYGYYFLVKGKGSNQWEFVKSTPQGLTVLKRGQTRKIVFKSDKNYWLKVEAKGSHLQAYLSRDGKSFAKVTSVTDSDFPFGQVGVATFDQTLSFFDDFYFKAIR